MSDDRGDKSSTSKKADEVVVEHPTTGECREKQTDEMRATPNGGSERARRAPRLLGQALQVERCPVFMAAAWTAAPMMTFVGPQPGDRTL